MQHVNNVSHRQFTVSGGPTTFSFSPVSPTVRMQPAIQVWAGTGATVNQVRARSGKRRIIFVGYKVTGPTAVSGTDEYAIYNGILICDPIVRSCFSRFRTPSPDNIGFHAPPQHPGGQRWHVQQPGLQQRFLDFHESFTLRHGTGETLAAKSEANAIRWEHCTTSDLIPARRRADSTANVGFFKTGSPISVQILAPLSRTPRRHRPERHQRHPNQQCRLHLRPTRAGSR